VYGAEKTMADMGDKLGASDKAALESAITELKNAVSSNDTAAMNRAMEQLTQAQHKAAETLYKQQAGPAASAGGPGPGGAEAGAGPDRAAEGDVIDAEVVEDEKK
jgi:molecular chaperone DnaK